MGFKNIGSSPLYEFSTKGNRKERIRQQQQNGGEEGKLEALHLFLRVSWRKTDSCRLYMSLMYLINVFGDRLLSNCLQHMQKSDTC